MAGVIGMELQRNEALASSPLKNWAFYLACLGGILLFFVVFFSTPMDSLGLIAAYLVVYSLIYLLIAAVLSEKTHNVKLVSPQSTDPKHVQLHQAVSRISKEAGLEVKPKVGIYQSDDMNAFAMGMSKRNSMIAFSSSLLEKMDAKSIEAVAAHEISHIVNGDMVTMCLLHALINGFAFIVKLPFTLIKYFIMLFATDRVEFAAAWLFGALSRLVRATVAFVGNLLEKAFSRKREYKADLGAAYLVDPQSMIQALKVLSSDTSTIPQEQQNYAAFKINAPARLFNIFSTHPPIEKRVIALQKYTQEKSVSEATENHIDDHEGTTQLGAREEKSLSEIAVESQVDSFDVAQMQLPTQTEDDNPGEEEAPESMQIPQTAASVGDLATKEPITLLRNLKELVDLGILTPEEFDEKKKRILDCI
jgi:heat shock protein HtpX